MGGTMRIQLFCNREKILRVVLTAWFAVTHRFIRFLVWAYWGKGKVVPPIQNPLLLKSATTLAEEIRKGKLKSEEVILAYKQRIEEVEPYINATVECVFEDAIKKAREVDELVASGKYTEEQLARDKPLLGVPFSVKVLLSVKGLLSTAGSMFFKDVRAPEDSPCVALMKNAGAIVIATTNCSECGLHVEVSNLVHGRTCNPYNTSRTSGGSSGGESALLSAGGSILGIGNDLLGSIRLPCHLTGLFGHKPSRGLVPCSGMYPVVDSTIDDFQNTGPMCRYSEDLVTSMKVISVKNDLKLKFGGKVNFKKMKICYMVELDDIFMSPMDKEIAGGLKKAVSYFQTQYGTSAKEVKLPSMTNINVMGMHIIISSIKDLKHTITEGKGSHIDERIDLIKYLFGKSAFSFGPLIVLNLSKYPIYNKKRAPIYFEKLKKLVKEFEDLLDDDTVLFFPTFPVTAPYHEEMSTRFPSLGYTGVFNFVGLPATQCPLGFSKEGLPFGMQVIGKMNNDPLTIACAVELEKAFGGWVQPGKP